MTPEELELVLKGSIIGHLLGDALGYCYSMDNFIPADLFMKEGPNDEPPGSYSFNGAFMLCTMASINECNEINLDDMIEKFHESYISGYLNSGNDLNNVGLVTTQALKNHSNGVPPDRCGIISDDANEAEPLARILPLGIYLAKESIDTLVDSAHAVCSLTHGNVLPQVCCALYTLIVRNILIQRPEKAFELLRDYYSTKKMEDHVKEIDLLRGWSATKKKNSHNVADCFWISWNAFATNEDDFEFAVRSSIQDGGFSHGVGAVTGGLVGMTLGLDDIRQQWLRTLNISQEAMDVVDDFIKIVAAKIL